jgi:hypothetical protein
MAATEVLVHTREALGPDPDDAALEPLAVAVAVAVVERVLPRVPADIRAPLRREAGPRSYEPSAGTFTSGVPSRRRSSNQVMRSGPRSTQPCQW